MFADPRVWDRAFSDEDVDRGTRYAEQLRDLGHGHNLFFVLVRFRSSHIGTTGQDGSRFSIRIENFDRARIVWWRPTSSVGARPDASHPSSHAPSSASSFWATHRHLTPSENCSDVAAQHASARTWPTRMGTSPITDGAQRLRSDCESSAPARRRCADHLTRHRPPRSPPGAMARATSARPRAWSPWSGLPIVVGDASAATPTVTERWRTRCNAYRR